MWENLHSPDTHIKVLLLCLFQEGIQEKTNRKRKGSHTAGILARRIPSTKGYLTVKEAVLLYGISRDVLYRMIRQSVIPSHNSGQRQTRLSRQYMDEHFKKKPMRRNSKKETLSFEPKDCYTIGQIAKKFHINEGTVLTHIRRNSIPTRQIGSYVYVPKSEIDKLYKSL